MGRSSKEQAERNRNLVVETACALFREHGVENVSISDIMSAAGLTNGGFYKHFESKEALIAEAFDMAFKQSSESWTQVRKPGNGAAALVEHYFKRADPARTCPMLSFASQASTLTQEAEALQIYRQGTRDLFEQFDEALRKRDDSANQLTEQERLLRFAAMIGAGMLGRAMGDTPWIKDIQEAVQDAV